MISITDALNSIIQSDPILKTYWSIGILNKKKLAVLLAPEIQKRTFKEISLESIHVALTKLKPLQLSEQEHMYSVPELNISFSHPFSLRTWTRTPEIVQQVQNFKDKHVLKGSHISYVMSVEKITLIIKSALLSNQLDDIGDYLKQRTDSLHLCILSDVQDQDLQKYLVHLGLISQAYAIQTESLIVQDQTIKLFYSSSEHKHINLFKRALVSEKKHWSII